jgi:hypothetical protein
MLLHKPALRPDELHAITGWEINPEGACKDDVCVPLTGLDPADDGTLDMAAFADRMGMPLVADEQHALWALGPRSGGNVLADVELPELVFSDFEGSTFDLASLRGRKVLLLAWASW